jgi:hypothetical protein
MAARSPDNASMPITRTLPFVLSLSFALAIVAAAPAGAAQDRCAFKGSKTLRQTSKLRLYRLPGTGDALSDRFYVCVRSNGRRFRADDRRSPEVTMLKNTLTSAGNFAAVAYTYYANEDAVGLTVVVIDLRTGKQTKHTENPDEFSAAKVPALVLGSSGGAAWIFEETPISSSEGTRLREVHAARTGAIRKLDEGLDIAATSLRLSGSTVSWTKGGAAQSAPLP